MSSYVYKEAIRYKLPKEVANEVLEEFDFEEVIKKAGLNPEKFSIETASNFETGETEVYLDKNRKVIYDEITADIAEARYLSLDEARCHLGDFMKWNPEINAIDLRAVKVCYYNGCDAPACYDITPEATQDWIF